MGSDEHAQWCLGHREGVGARLFQVGRVVALQLNLHAHIGAVNFQAGSLCVARVDDCLGLDVALGNLVASVGGDGDGHRLASGRRGIVNSHRAAGGICDGDMLLSPRCRDATGEHHKQKQ